MMERYAILWLVAGATVLVLALWQGLLTTLSHLAGICYHSGGAFCCRLPLRLGDAGAFLDDRFAPLG